MIHQTFNSLKAKVVGLSPFPVTVTTRIITFLVEDPELNLHLPLLLGGGTTQLNVHRYSFGR